MLATNSDSGLKLERSSKLPAIVHTTSFDQATEFVDRILDEGAGLYLLTGEPEVGKTAVLEYCSSRSDESVKLLYQKFRRIDADNLSALLNEAFGVTTNTSLEPQGLALRYFHKLGTLHSKGQRFVFIIDDLETIHSSGAELIKALLQMKAEKEELITILLCGDTSLVAVLDKFYRRDIQNLIEDVFKMQPLGVDEARAFIDQIPKIKCTKMIDFKPKAKSLLYKVSGGIPGKLIRLGHLAGKYAGKSNSHIVTPAMVKLAAGEEHQSLGPNLSNIDWRWLAVAAITILLSIVMWTQNVIKPTDSGLYPQLVVSEEEPSSELDSIVPTQQSVVQNAQPDIAVIEDNIFIGSLSAAAGPSEKIADRSQSPSYHMTIPAQRESTKFLFQGAHTLIPAQPM